MKTIDKLLFGLLFGFSFPLFFFLMALTLWYYLFQNFNVLYFVLPGVIAGILIDALYLKKLIFITLNLPTWTLIGFYLFYNICIYGFFMGFPVFNLGMGIIAGYYFGIRINHENSPLKQVEYLRKSVPFFTTLVMVLICISTALIALSEKTLGLELQGMFRLRFQVTKGMIISIILIGGIGLIVTQYYLTKIIMNGTIKNSTIRKTIS
jgi:hypothetical protein